MSRQRRAVARKWWRAWNTWAVVAVMSAWTGGEAFAVSPPASKKMARQIEVMEKILDQVLLESPNFLIRGTPVAHGAYIPSFGVLFLFDASLTGQDWEHLKNWDFPGFKIEEKNGKRVIILPDEEDTPVPPDEEEEVGEVEGGDPRDVHRRRQERTYGRGKTELVDVLLDYGDTLSTLEANQWVAIMACMTDEDFVDRARMSRLILKAKMSDLRAYGAGTLSEEEMVKRIVEEEY
jgi:hypothetical protein